MGDLYFRFFKDDGSGGGQIVIDLSMSAWSASVTYYVGEYTKVGMTVYQCLIANTNKPPATEPTYWSVRTVGNPVEIITTYTEDEVFDLKGPQSADTLYIFHELHPPMKLVRHSHINWELVEFVCLDKKSRLITNITNANPPVVTCPGHGRQAYDYIYIEEVVGMVEVNDLRHQVGAIDADTFYLYTENSLAYASYISGGSFSAAITAITKASPGVVTMPRHGFINGDKVLIYGVQGMVELNGNIYEVANRTNTTFELKDTNTSGYTTYTGGGTAAKKLF